jgi:hypothetical protein
MTLTDFLLGKEKLSILDFVKKYADVMTVAMLMDLCKLNGLRPSKLFETELFEQED